MAPNSPRCSPLLILDSTNINSQKHPPPPLPPKAGLCSVPLQCAVPLPGIFLHPCLSDDSFRYSKLRSVSLEFQNPYFGLERSQWPSPATSLASFHNTLILLCSEHTVCQRLSTPCPRPFELALSSTCLALLPTIHMTHPSSQSSSHVKVTLSGGLHWLQSKIDMPTAGTSFHSALASWVCLHGTYHDLTSCYIFGCYVHRLPHPVGCKYHSCMGFCVH